jgi:hypothetical protein
MRAAIALFYMKNHPDICIARVVKVQAVEYGKR